MPPSVPDLETYLGSQVDPDRGQMLLDMAVSACESVVTPLPEGSGWVVLDVAANAYASPVGPGGAITVGGVSTQAAAGGVFLTKRQSDALRRLAGRAGSAFTVDTTPARRRRRR